MAAVTLVFLFLLFLPANAQENSKVELDPCTTDIPFPGSIPALYVFGDSTVDPGNNNYIDKAARANYLPYGIDFNNTPTGRFTNGKTIADFIAVAYNLPLPPAYLSLTEAQKKTTMGGINYASAGCGIFPGTRPPTKDCYNLVSQVNAFQRTMQEDLPSMIKDPQQLADYLANSIFFISMGANDYIFGFNQGRDNPDTFANLLLDKLKFNMGTLHKSGARKFLVNNIGPLGCLPSMVNKTGNDQCDEQMNLNIMPYIDNLPKELKNFQVDFPDTNLTLADSHSLLHYILTDPDQAGFTDIKDPCCGNYVNGQLECPPDSTPCEYRDEYLFFDGSHTSEYANCMFVTTLFVKD